MTALTPAAPARRLILVPAATPRAGRDPAAVRRYRLARLRLEGREVARKERFAPSRRFAG